MILDRLINYTIKSDNFPSEEEKRRVRAFILVWISTVIIMWFYVFFSWSVFEFNTVAYIGLVCTIIHTLTPTIYRHTKSLVLAGLNISLTALVFQITFCIFNGGIDSPSAIWFTAHPVIISYFASKRLILFSVILNMFVVIGLTLLSNKGFFPVDALEDTFTDWMRISSLIFLDIIVATYTIVFMNTTKQNEVELSNRNELIENLMRIISHDINNALTVSTLSTNMLEKNLKDDQDASRRIKMIKKSNDQIIEITNSIQMWMKTNKKSFNLKLTPTSFSTITKHIEDSFQPLIQVKSILLDFDIDSTITSDTKILIDSSAFRNQVLNNLISNAIKFTPQNGRISFKAEVKSDFIKIQVIDKGIGIPSKILNVIFDPSCSKSRPGTNGEQGTGFGLPIVKRMLEEMNGSIKIDSTVKTDENDTSGTTMSILIPLVQN